MDTDQFRACEYRYRALEINSSGIIFRNIWRRHFYFNRSGRFMELFKYRSYRSFYLFSCGQSERIYLCRNRPEMLPLRRITASTGRRSLQDFLPLLLCHWQLIIPDISLQPHWVPGLYRSTNNGDQWLLKDSGISNPDIKSVAVNANGIVFAGTLDGVYRINKQW